MTQEYIDRYLYMIYTPHIDKYLCEEIKDEYN